MDGNDGPVWDPTAPVQVDPSPEEEPEPTTFAVHARWAAVAAVGALVVGLAVGHQLTPTRTTTVTQPAVTTTVTATPVDLEPTTQPPSPSAETWTVTRQVAATRTVTRQVTAVQTVVRVIAGPTRTVRVPGPVRVIRATATVVRRGR